MLCTAPASPVGLLSIRTATIQNPPRFLVTLQFQPDNLEAWLSDLTMRYIWIEEAGVVPYKLTS